MNKRKINLFYLALLQLVFFTSTYSYAQDSTQVQVAHQQSFPTDFRGSYIRLGLNNVSDSELNSSMSPYDNVRDGKIGASKGYTFEWGRNFYFNKRSYSSLKYGLDWTIINLSYTELDWAEYIESSTGQSGDPDIFHGASLSTKLGPVISYNPVEELIVDFRAQLGLSYHAMLVDYYDESTEDYFTMFAGDGLEGAMSDMSLYPSFGLTIRRKAIGLSVDYFKQNVNMPYESENDGEGMVEVPLSSVQFKLTFSLR
ncbi:hypothetical protein KZP23_07830 [Echinicola marina]|uniref:hypothetical protein n=1 Tax=Echinicola marina TaxID=2859768 RepID=UPI001CF685DE|nr:hypothetical protein [Echinicola marina]UCS94911.1 hypothetical protein KZP23_07830 [Echinicola marina]